MSDLEDWQQVGAANWRQENQQIVGGGAGDGYLVSPLPYSNYLLTVEFNVDATTNSGVFVNCTDPNNITPLTCYEINIWDDHPRQEFRTGAIVTRVEPLVKLDTVGQWNIYEIEVRSNIIEARLNGTVVSRLENPEQSSGLIALQRAVDGEVRFRNIRVQY